MEDGGQLGGSEAYTLNGGGTQGAEGVTQASLSVRLEPGPIDSTGPEDSVALTCQCREAGFRRVEIDERLVPFFYAAGCLEPYSADVIVALPTYCRVVSECWGSESCILHAQLWDPETG
ncbi:hypothetical protein RHMOL_Rhmol12G0011500 [Rhododendron molle]|uniref:Uncharacterized protein n=1 Tax=Rhododendron molle TaxID=49168 RepID=A0ACC0LDD2_RHOML|nr:hypothetical protein RHMOL_Rhmol12G0011500 [Rhododendron molle]